MTSLLNALNIDLACYGNHDFDFGEERLKDLIKHTHFPWTLTNVAQGDRLLAEAKRWIVRDVGDFKIGFLGLAGTCVFRQLILPLTNAIQRLAFQLSAPTRVRDRQPGKDSSRHSSYSTPAGALRLCDRHNAYETS